MSLATFVSIWTLGKLVEFGIIFIICITSSYKAQKSPPLPTSKLFIYYSNDYSDKTISHEESKNILFFKVKTVKMHLLYQTTGTSCYFWQNLYFLEEHFFFFNSNFSYLWEKVRACFYWFHSKRGFIYFKFTLTSS